MKRILALAALAIAMTSTLATAQSTTDVAVNDTASTSCPSGEAVALNGVLHLAFTSTTDAATGINNYQIAVLSDISGTGQATQTDYAGENASFGYNFPTTDSPAQISLQLGSRLFSKGAAPSLQLTQTLNITADTAGHISASTAGSNTQCAN
jgi:Tfp pilus assembly protein PilX